MWGDVGTARRLLAGAVIAEAPIQPFEQVGAPDPDLLVNSERADETADAALPGGLETEERQQVRRVCVRRQLAVVAIRAGVRVGGRDVDHVPEPLPHHRLRHRATQTEAHGPEEELDLRTAQLIDRKPVDDVHPLAVGEFRPEVRDEAGQLPESKVGRRDLLELDPPLRQVAAPQRQGFNRFGGKVDDEPTGLHQCCSSPETLGWKLRR